MKKILIFSSVFFLLLLALFSSGVSACMHSIDNYAVEVVLSKPDIQIFSEKLDNAKNVIFSNEKYIFMSQYSLNIYTIISNNSRAPYTSIRLQAPAETLNEKTTSKKVYFTASGTLKLELENSSSFNNWTVECTKDLPTSQCFFSKDLFSVTVNLVSDEKYSVFIEVKTPFSEDNSACTTIPIKPKFGVRDLCFDSETYNLINGLISSIGLIQSSSTLRSPDRAESTTGEVIDLRPLYNESVGWPVAMKQELLWLRMNDILRISLEEIDEISYLSLEGKAGQNNRIYYGESANGNVGWIYYGELKNPDLTNLLDCNEFEQPNLKARVIFQQSVPEVSSYYLIPLIITLVIIAVLVILFFISRILLGKQDSLKSV
jgi:hypothetical protein